MNNIYRELPCYLLTKKENTQRFCYRAKEQEQTLRVSRISFPEDEFLRDCEKVWDGLVNLSVGAPFGMNGWVEREGKNSRVLLARLSNLWAKLGCLRAYPEVMQTITHTL